MNVIAHAPHSWFLLLDLNDLYLDVNCNRGAVGFSILLRLTREERDAYRDEGQSAIERLAAGVQDRPNGCWDRNLDATWHQMVTQAVREWRSEQPD